MSPWTKTARPTAFSLTLNAMDPDATDILTWSILTPAGHGVATASGTGYSQVVDYVPDADYNGMDNFDVQVNDGHGHSDCITVNVTINPINDPPVNTTPPSVTGTPHPGFTLNAIKGTWNDLKDGGSSTLSYTYQWQLADDAIGTNLVNINGATTNTLIPTPAMISKYVSVKVTASDDGVPMPPASASALSLAVKIMNNAPTFVGGRLPVTKNIDEVGGPHTVRSHTERDRFGRRHHRLEYHHRRRARNRNCHWSRRE